TPMRELSSIIPSGIRGLFDAIVSGDSVKKGKPHPEPYLEASRILGLRPQDCLVVENAPFGIESAKKAGMFCIAITTGLPREYLRQADITVERLDDIIGLIEKTRRR
ncbi:MAG: HAD family phosphatase, partial [Candidatus Omnitrophota bacterium]